MHIVIFAEKYFYFEDHNVYIAVEDEFSTCPKNL